MKMIKKRIMPILLLLTLSVIALSACGAEKVKIEDYEWKMRTVMRSDTDDLVLAVGEADEVYPEAKVVDLRLNAKDGKLTITDATNNKTYEGTYSVEDKTPDGTNYKITIDGKDGYATVSMTEYYDGSKEPTLPINLGDCSIYFYAN